MRSLRYLINGDPQNFDDCRDILNKGSLVENIYLSLSKEEESFGEIIRTALYGKFKWEFSGKKVEYKEDFGGIIFPYDDEARQNLSVRYANERLEDSLKKFERLDLEVRGKEKRFDYPIPEKNWPKL